jgi:predicted O-methyltransferase YrrM
MKGFKFDDKELAQLIPILKRLVSSDSQIRMKIQRAGINVIPCNFYSATPSIDEIENSFEFASDEPSYSHEAIFDKKNLCLILEKLARFAPEFNPPMDGDAENCQRFFWKNEFFSYSDAMAYYCFIRLLKPTTIVEIGSGFSTLAALEAIAKNGVGKIHCVEPYPRKFLKRNKQIALHPIKAQAIELEMLNDTLQDGDILFIDSTHTVKCGSDCLHIYLRLLPKIRRNIIVHAHDIYLPFGMPKDKLLNDQIYWNEQYLILALLIDNPKTSLLYGSTCNAKWHPNLMYDMMGNKYPLGGASIWFSYRGNPAQKSRQLF